jgi:uncharacterized delta-60 repeat protein
MDLGFSTDGKATLGFNLGGTNNDSSSAVAVQSDGKIIVVGSVDQGNGDYDFAVARYNKNGTLDTSFSGDGMRIIAFNLGDDKEDQATCVQIQADGKILIGGYAITGAGDFDFAVCRLKPDGTMDTTFSGDGKQTVSFGNKVDICNDLALAGGKIVLAGYATGPNDQDLAVVRLNANGSIDTTFGNNGKQTIAFNLGGSNNEYGEAVAIQSDGKIVIAGWGIAAAPQFSHMIVCRLHSNGVLDSSFSGDGKRNFGLTNVADSYDVCQDLAIQSDGKIVMVGWTTTSTSNLDFAVVRLNGNGTFDNNFGSQGKKMIAFDKGGNQWDQASSVAIQQDGKIVVAGTVDFATDKDMAVVRLNPNGSLDNTLAETGKTTHFFDQTPGKNDICHGMVITPEGIVLVGHVETASNGLDFAITRLVRDNWVIVSADQGGPPRVKILTPTGLLLKEFDAYGASFMGGVRTAVGDINGDWVPDIFCAPGPGGLPYVNVYDGVTLGLIKQIQVYGLAFTKGVNLTVGNVLSDAKVELLVSPDVGGAPYVNIFDPNTGTLMKQLLVYGESFTLGVRITTWNQNGGTEKLVVAPMAGGSPVVNVFNVATSTLEKQLQTYPNNFTFGLYIACADMNGGAEELLVGPGQAGISFASVRVYNVTTGALVGDVPVFGLGYNMGIRVSSVAPDGVTPAILAASGPGAFPTVKIKTLAGADVSVFYPFEPSMTAGLFVSGAHL